MRYTPADPPIALMPSSLTRRYAAAVLGPVERWFIPALILTALLHVAGYYFLHETKFSGFAPPRDFRPPSRVFQVHQATIDPKTLDDPKEPTEKIPTKPVPDVTDIQIPGDTKPNYQKVMQEAETVIAAPESDQTMAMDKPRVEPSRVLDKLAAEDNPQQLPSDLKSLTDQLLNGKPNVTGSHPSFEVTGNTNSSRPNAGPNAGVPNFSNLDGLLSSKGPLTNKTAPILLPTDLLFDYNSADLKSAAVGSLQKLAELIERNPTSTFTIEGHTDSFGPPDYNMSLSVARAESVKAWLVEEAAIDPNRIQTRGMGMTRLLVAGGSVDQQRLNRRVEIIIHTNRH